MELTDETLLGALARAPRSGWRASQIAAVLGVEPHARKALRRQLERLAAGAQLERLGSNRFRVPGAGGAPGREGEEDTEPGLGAAPTGSAEARVGVVEARAGAEAGAGLVSRPKPGVTGRIRVHPAGYAFVVRDDGEEDVFVPARYRGAALDGDKVRLTTWIGYKGTEGRVADVLERGRAKITGTLRSAGRTLYLEPDDPRIAATSGAIALPDGANGARAGDSIVAEIVRYPAMEGAPMEARVSHVLGDPDDPRTEIAKVLICGDIPTEFAPDTLQAARRAPSEVRPEDLADRVDLRDLDFLTIDPETARDFDDAVCVERPRGDGAGDGAGAAPWRLWVAIADVSHYVRPNTALDREARARGCSVYLPDRAIPMLPHELSAGICSLNPEVDRLAMVARLDLDAAGAVVGRTLCAGVIRSRARLDYPGVAAALDGDFRGPRARYRPWEQALKQAKRLGDLLRARRMARGSLDFDLPEAAVILDEDDPRRVRDVRRSKPTEEIKTAYRLVEEFMLAANEAVATYFRERELDTVWRVHDVPDGERVEAFLELAEALGVPVELGRGLGRGALTPKKLQELLARIAGRPSERALSYLLLRSLKQAVYDVTNIGHFGLASAEYLHFTSPIRRYPDLLVHRLLKHRLHHEAVAAGLGAEGARREVPPPRTALAQMAAESSACERRAMEAEREVVDMYRAFLMRDRIGEEYDATISGVTGFGFFVEVAEPFVEGLVRIESLGDDSYEFDEPRCRLVGRRSGRAFALGDEVRVRVESVSVARRKVEVALVAGGVFVERPRRKRGKEPGRPRGRGDGRGGRSQRPGRKERGRRGGRT